MQARHYVYVAKDGTVSFGRRLGDVGERGNTNRETVSPEDYQALDERHQWMVTENELVLQKEHVRRISACLEPCTVYEVTPDGIKIVLEGVQPGPKQFEQVPAQTPA